MKVALFQKLLAIYRDQIGGLFPRNDSLRILTMLAVCQEGPLTPGHAIERTGFSQSAVSKLLKKFSDLGIIEPSGTRKRYEQAVVLTNKGRKLAMRLEDAVGKLFSGELEEDPAQVEDFSKVEPIVRAYAEKNPERYKRYLEREKSKTRFRR